MRLLKKYYNICVIFFVCLLAANPLYAGDNIAAAKSVEGKYTAAYYAANVDTADLVRRLNPQPSDAIIAGLRPGRSASYEDELANMLDALYGQVSDILDIHLYSPKVNIRICGDNNQLKAVYSQMFHGDLGARESFYVYDSNTVYVSEEGFKRGIVGHEMAHAIISHYFVVPAPVKIQEVLSMYVEYNLRRPER